MREWPRSGVGVTYRLLKEKVQEMAVRRRMRGFNFIEVVIVLAILGVLLALGLPGYGTFVANQKVRSSAEVFKTMMMMARAEAVKLNQQVEFLRTDDEPVEANVADADAISSATGANWMVRARAATGNTFIEGRFGVEGTGAAAGGTSSVLITGTEGSLVFDGFGMRITPTGATPVEFDFSNPGAGACAADGGPIRCLRVRISRGGQARLCDPAVTDAADSRGCGI